MTFEITYSFPPEIIREILLKLPVESLLRCKSVCKEWYSLISEQHFIKAHYTLSSNNINSAHLVFILQRLYSTRKLKSCPLNDVLFHNSVNNALEYPFKCNLHNPQIRIVGSCNGLLCILFEGTIFIYNPSTRKLNRLYCRYKVFWRVFGFGYDELNDDYKVIEVFHHQSKVKIYSLKTGKWKNICKFPNDYKSYAPGLFSNGALHWAQEINPNPGSSNQWKIHSLNLTNDTFDQVLQPEYDEGDMKLELGVLGQWLCVLCNYFNSHADLWVLKVYGVRDSWTKLASIPFGPIWHHYLNNYYYLKFFNPLCISNDGKVLFQSGDKYFVFDSKNISFTLVSKEIDAYSQSFTFVESLVSPNYAFGICNRLRSSRKRLRNLHVSS